MPGLNKVSNVIGAFLPRSQLKDLYHVCGCAPPTFCHIVNTTLCVPPVGEPERYPVPFASSSYGKLYEPGISETLTNPSRVWVR